MAMSSFPRSDINPKSKDVKWFAEYAQSIWDDWREQGSNSFYSGANRYNRLEYYAQGKQSTEVYKPKLSVDDKNKTWMSIDWTPIAILPKMVRIINSLFRKIVMIPTVSAIDPYSEYDKTDYYQTEKANIEMRSILGQAGLDPSLMNDGTPDQPKSSEELQIKMDFTWKHNTAIGIEKGLEKFSFDIAWEEEREKTREFLIKRGAGGYKILTDSKTGKVDARAVDPSCFICSATKDPYMRDIWYAGEIVYPLISEIRVAMQGRIHEDDLEQLALKNKGKFGNPINYTEVASEYNIATYDSARIPVLDVSFKDENIYIYDKRTLDNGNFVLGKTDKKKKDRVSYEDRRNDIFKCMWVIGTQHVYGNGLENDMVKKPSRYWDAHLPYIMTAPSLFNMETTCIVEEVIPNVDAAHIAWFKLQNVVASARPKGVEIEIGALEDVPLADNGETMTPLQLIDLFNKKGILVYRRIDPSGQVSNYSPIRELNNGLGTEAQEYFAVIEKNINFIKNFLGLNDITDGSTPDERMLNGVASLAAEATNNALHHIFNAEKNLFERLFDNAACRIYDSIAFKDSEYYSDSVGESTYESIAKGNKKHLRELGVVVEYAPNPQEQQQLNADISRSIELQQITIADKYMILNIRNTKQAQQILAYRVRKTLEENRKFELQKIQQTTQQQERSTMVAEEEKRKTLMIEDKIKKEQIDQEYGWKYKIEEMKVFGLGANKDTEMEKKKEIQEIVGTNAIEREKLKTTKNK